MFATRSPINVGAVYRATSNIDLTLAYERGNTVAFGVALHGNLKNASMPKIGDPPRFPAPPPIAAAPHDVASGNEPMAPLHVTPWSNIVENLQMQTSWHVKSVRQMGSDLIVQFDDAEAFYLGDAIDRITSALNREAPGDIRTFQTVAEQHGPPVADIRIISALVASEFHVMPTVWLGSLPV